MKETGMLREIIASLQFQLKELCQLLGVQDLSSPQYTSVWTSEYVPARAKNPVIKLSAKHSDAEKPVYLKSWKKSDAPEEYLNRLLKLHRALTKLRGALEVLEAL